MGVEYFATPIHRASQRRPEPERRCPQGTIANQSIVIGSNRNRRQAVDGRQIVAAAARADGQFALQFVVADTAAAFSREGVTSNRCSSILPVMGSFTRRL